MNGALNAMVRRWRSLRLSLKLCLGLAVLASLGLVLGAFALNQTVRPAFAQLEEEALARQSARAEAMLERALSVIENSTKDYAVWDDSYAYVETGDEAFETENVTELGLVNLGVDAMAYARADGRVLSALYVDLESETAVAALTRDFERLARSENIRTLANGAASSSEFVTVDGRVFAVGLAQVTRSDGSGTPTGYVMMARQLSDAMAADALQVDARISQDPGARRFATPTVWRVNVPIHNSAGEAIGSVAFEMPREITRLGAVAMTSALAAGAGLLAFVIIAVLVMLRALVVTRLEGVTAHVAKVAASRELEALPAEASADELGQLNASFNDMIAQLKDLRQQVEAQSFQLGQAELAAGVMHNVRNSLNPVSVIMTRALSEKSPLRAEDVVRAIGELRACDVAPERRERLATFLLEGFAEAERRCASNREALSTAKGSLGEALEILSAQNHLTQSQLPLERVDALEVLERSVATLRAAWPAGIDVQMPPAGLAVSANRLLLSQVIANLLTNAVGSIRSKDEAGRISIALAPCASGGAQITIEDDGIGFAADAKRRLFERGYSSKPVRSGLGLHWCANTVAAMGGSLSLDSEGPGRGARATLVLNATGFNADAPRDVSQAA